MRPDVTVWWADLTSADVTLAASLPDSERERLEGLTGADRARRAVGAALLRHAVAQHRAGGGRAVPQERAVSQDLAVPQDLAGAGGDDVDDPGTGIIVDRTCAGCGAQHGRPVVAGGPHVSVAHAGVLVVVATCAQAEVGVDVERETRLDDPHEAAAWVAREARLKAGLGTDESEGPGGVVPLEPPLPGYVAAVLTRSEDVPAVTVRRVTDLRSPA